MLKINRICVYCMKEKYPFGYAEVVSKFFGLEFWFF